MKRILGLVILLSGTVATQAQVTRIYSDAGNIVIERNGSSSKLTTSEMDLDPVLSPNGASVVYTRQGRGRSPRTYEFNQTCPTEPRPDQLRRINVDGSGDHLLLMCRKGEPQRQLCYFRSKQFSADGRQL